ncbi:hypothetical protein JW921_06535 [Candidatus Fermentibacterales bacterium]|nr:hypothetical protein [Candidatus Fermentibacterales bacterium]
MTARRMTWSLLVPGLVVVFLMALAGCGEQPARTGGDPAEGGERPGDVGEEPGRDVGEEPGEDREGPGDDETPVAAGDEPLDFDFETAEPEVGQWVTYGVDDQAGGATISIVGAEVFDGHECLWYQFDIPGEVTFKLLADFSQLAEAAEDFEEIWEDFAGDPETYIREMIETGGADWASGMMTSEDALESSAAFLRGLKTVIVEEGGVLVAYDLSGVADVLEPVMENPEMFSSMAGMSGMQMGSAGQPAVDTQEILEVLDDLEMSASPVNWQIGSQTVGGFQWRMEYAPEGVELEVVFSNELPILPLAYAKVTQDGESHLLEVRDFGFSGARDALPGQPARTIDVAQMLEGFVQMAQSGAMGRMPQ